MTREYQKKQKQSIEDKRELRSIIGLYEMLSQHETEVTSDYFSIIDKIEEIYESSESEEENIK